MQKYETWNTTKFERFWMIIQLLPRPLFKPLIEPINEKNELNNMIGFAIARENWF